MIIDEKTVALWFLVVNAYQDWQATLYQEGLFLFKLEYRHRYYDRQGDGSPWNGRDRKDWYEGTFRGDRDAALAHVRQVVRELERVTACKADEIVMGPGGPKEFMETLLTKPWAHVKKIERINGAKA